ncbi:MAG TPA: helix-turn-helix domain-containing protein [Baekduia sp.]|nr:helix-turn-helix domain-containing protein [Baekduia sp.]
MPVRSDSFMGRMWRYDVGAVSLHRVVAEASTVRRTSTLILADDPGLLQVALVTRGTWRVTQSDRSTVVQAGDLTSFTTWDPYEVRAMTPFEMILLSVPEQLLRPHSGRVSRQTALCVKGEGGAGRIVRDHLRGVVLGLQEGVVGIDTGHLADSLVDLVRGLALGQERSEDSPADLMGQIRNFIELHLGDSDLSRERIATAHFISKSYLDKLFGAEDIQVWRYIKERRLDRCRRDLQDPALAHNSILEIARRWGYTNAAHFSRTFATAYGQPPSEFRRAGVSASAAPLEPRSAPNGLSPGRTSSDQPTPQSYLR